ncbi:hypothetical protein HY495_02675 [Candidatus Woesearchaeota archaeon]|nr:hypothetical protein [Candidatus Woesearchaeota archaeon]
MTANSEKKLQEEHKTKKDSGEKSTTETEQKKTPAVSSQQKNSQQENNFTKNNSGKSNSTKNKNDSVLPLPEMAKDDLEGLSEEGKDILKAGKNLKQKMKEEQMEEKSTKSIRDQHSELEEQLRREHFSTLNAEKSPEYAVQLSQQPIDKIYHEMTSLYQTAGEKGYLSQEEQRRVQNLVSAVEKKVQDAEEHRYDLTEEAAAVAGITRQIGAKLRGLYKGNVEGYHATYRFD